MKSCTKRTGVSQKSLSASMEQCAFYDLVTGYFHAQRLRVAILPAEWGKGGVGSDESRFVGGGCVWGFLCVFFPLCLWINPESLTDFQVNSWHEREEMAS